MSKRFPLMPGVSGDHGPSSCAWEIAEKAYANYVKRFGSQQSLERIAQRGGFSWLEMDDQYPAWREEEAKLQAAPEPK